MSTLEKVSKPVPVPPKKQPLRIIAIGDSLIYGYGDPTGGGWVERLRRQWMAPDSAGHALYNLGIRGDRVCQVKERLEPEYSYRGEFRNQFPDLIILSVGVNDTPRLGHEYGRNLTDFDTFQAQINLLLHQANKLSPVIFIGMVPIDESKMPFVDCLYYNHQDQYRYKQATKQACEKYHTPYLDIFDLWMARGEAWRTKLLGKDGLHPNELGYQALLKDILNWTPLLQLP